MWNLPYHAEHHLLPNIAFHHLPEAHQYLRPHLKHVAKGYIQVNREIVRSFEAFKRNLGGELICEVW